jgi:hypothetical protein
MLWMTCALDGREHAVADEQVCAGADRGRYLALCGRLIAPSALTCPPGRRCLTCHVHLAPTTSTRTRPPWWRRARLTAPSRRARGDPARGDPAWDGSA